MKIQCEYKQVNGDCSHPSGNRSCTCCVPTDETIANAMPKMAEHGKDGVTIEEIEPEDAALKHMDDMCLDPAEYRGNDYGDDDATNREDDPNKVNYGKTKDGKPLEADGITTFCCYQCLHTVYWLNEDSRCKDCTRLTPEETRGEVESDEYLEGILDKDESDG